MVKELLGEIGCGEVNVVSATKIGNGCNELLLTLLSVEDKQQILSRAPNLRRSKTFMTVYIRADLTRFQRKQEKALRETFGRSAPKLLWQNGSLYPV